MVPPTSLTPNRPIVTRRRLRHQVLRLWLPDPLRRPVPKRPPCNERRERRARAFGMMPFDCGRGRATGGTPRCGARASRNPTVECGPDDPDLRVSIFRRSRAGMRRADQEPLELGGIRTAGTRSTDCSASRRRGAGNLWPGLFGC
jgi:hypothetical protein